MAGTKQLTELILAVAALGAAVHAAGDDGKINIWDAPKFVGALRQMPAAFGDIAEVPGELADLEPGEAIAIVQAIEGKVGDVFPIGSKAHDIAAAALKAVPGVVGLIKSFTRDAPPRAEPVEEASV